MNPKSNGINTTIRLTVVAVCAVASLLTAILAVGLQFYFGQAMAREAASNLYATAAAGVANELHNVGRVNANVIQLLANNAALADLALQETHVRNLARVLENNPLYYSAYIGNAGNELLEVINLDVSAHARETLGAAPQDRWLLVRVEPGVARTDVTEAPGNGTGIKKGNLRHLHFLDEQFRERVHKTENTDYAVTSRPWYQDAMASGTFSVTPPYLFAQTGIAGRTISQRIANSDAVIGVDMTMASISEFLQRSRVEGLGQIYLFTPAGQVIGSSDDWGQDRAPTNEPGAQRDLPSPELAHLAASPDLHGELVETDIAGEGYFAFVQRVSAIDAQVYMGVLSPRDAVIDPYLERVKYSIGASALFLLLLLPLSWFIANPIVKPVKQLARENKKVQRRRYDEVKRVDTHVRELAELSDSMVEMVDAIQAHELAQRELMDSIIKLIAEAIDDKSAYTGGHCERVPELALMLAQDASDSNLPAFRDFELTSEEQWREFQIAAWLHDCGKITTPEHIVDKGSKLETIYNRIHEVRTRFEVLWRDAEIDCLRNIAANPELESRYREELARQREELRADFAFVAECNVGGEYLDEEKLARLRHIATRSWQRNFSARLGLSPVEELRLPATPETLPAAETLLSDRPEHIIEREQSTDYPPEMGIDMDIPEHLANLGEVYNLSISRGTLTPEDRFRINEHMISTIKMLGRLPFPEELANVPRYASTHHETMKGTGYPRRLPGEQLSIPERMLAIADIFEALTASDRPYKKAKSVSAAIGIMYKMVLDEHIDRDCFELFLTSGTYLRYARAFLAAEQLDEVDIARYLPDKAA
jgi:HD-GYP domain-containing protein (c-di-GMP phosphodiesterase class II)